MYAGSRGFLRLTNDAGQKRKMRIENQNLAINNDLRNTSQVIARALERLSTGKRLNSPADGVADYSTSLRLDSQIKGLAQINLGLNQATGLLQTASSAIGSQIEIVQQMREIAIRGANTFLSTSERDGLNSELIQLREEFNRIANSTEFAGIDLFNNPNENISFLLDEQTSLNIDSADNSANDLFRKISGGAASGTQVRNTNSFETYEIQSADFNGDGFDDLLNFNTATNVISVQLSDGEGSFNDQQTFSSSGSSIRIADINGDGNIDFATDDTGDDVFNFYLGDGNGSFTFNSSSDYTAGITFSSSHEFGDFDGDGDQDLIQNLGNTLGVLLNDGTGSFSAQSTFSLDFAPAEIADVNNDGFDDLIGGSGTTYSVSLSNGDGTFATRTTTLGSAAASEIIAIDFDNDGNLDLAASTQGGLNIFLGDGTGQFTLTQSFENGLGQFNDLDITDYNNDGIADLVAANYDNESLDIFIGNGSGGFSLFTQLVITGNTGAYMAGVTAGDFNGDGIEDFFFVEDLATGYLISATEDVSAVSDLKVDKAEDSERLLGILDDAIEGLTTIQSDIASDLTRAEVASNANLLLSEDLSEAKLSLESADFALETANLVAAQIQQQAQIAALTQANSNLSIVLQLLDL